MQPCKPFNAMSQLISERFSITKLADVLLCCYNTAKRRLENPENITLCDLKLLCQRGHIPVEELLDAIIEGGEQMSKEALEDAFRYLYERAIYHRTGQEVKVSVEITLREDQNNGKAHQA